MYAMIKWTGREVELNIENGYKLLLACACMFSICLFKVQDFLMGLQKNGADTLAQPWDVCNTYETNKWVTECRRENKMSVEKDKESMERGEMNNKKKKFQFQLGIQIVRN